jgi:hypothetical protein
MVDELGGRVDAMTRVAEKARSISFEVHIEEEGSIDDSQATMNYVKA